MNDYQLIPVESGLFFTFDFTNEMPENIDVQDVVFTCTPSVTLSNQSNDFAYFSSTIKVSGATHGTWYNLQAKASLTNGEILVKDACLLGFNG